MFNCIDLGASNTRYCSEDGKIRLLPNNTVFIKGDNLIDMETDDTNIESCLEVIITKKGTNGLNVFPAHILVGDMASRYPMANTRPSTMTNKTNQAVNYTSAILSTALSLLYSEDKDPNICINVALPPVEASSNKGMFKEELLGEYSVKFPRYHGGIEVTFRVNEVQVYEESFMAVLSFFFAKSGNLNEEAKPYTVGNILSLDIGASTTDLVIVKDSKYQDKTGQTYKIGGNVARDFLIKSIVGKYGFEMPEDDADTVMATGLMQLGSKHEDVSDLVSNAKDQFSAEVVASFQSYFRRVNFPLQSLKAIIISGGGSMPSQYVDTNGKIVVTSPAMSEYITNALKSICASVEVRHYGDQCRLANINGLFVRARLNKFKEQLKNKATPAPVIETIREEVEVQPEVHPEVQIEVVTI